MKAKQTIKALTAAFLLAGTQSGTQAAALLADGNFDGIPVGTAPDVGTPAGHWFWPADYSTFDEQAASQLSIAPAPAGSTGNALRLSFTATESPGLNAHLPNILARPVTAASGQILHVSFDIHVAPGRGGGAIILGTTSTSDRGPQLEWFPNGQLLTRNSSAVDTTLIDSYPRGVWQTVRLEVDVARARFNFYWGEKGQPVSVSRTNLGFRASSVAYIDRFHITRFADTTNFADAESYFDNIQVSAGEPAAVVPGQSIVAPGGSVTLSLTNTLGVPSTYQWQFNGTNLSGATSSTLALSSLTLDQSGPYSVIVSNEYEVVTAAAATVQVVDRVTIASQPQGTNATNGANVTLSVTALSPLPITYQWQFNGVDLPGQTASTLTLTNVQLADDGAYTVVATDALRSVISQPATLTVLVKPEIVQAPLSQSVVAGGSLTLSVSATGNPLPLNFRWRRGGTTIANLTLHETNCFLTLTNLQPSPTTNRFTYTAVVTNIVGSSALSSSAVVTVLADSDSDGLPDEWEVAHALSATDAADALFDADGDGQSNVAEYRSGTSPTNAASYLKLEGVTQADGQATVSFNPVSNQTYTVEWSAQPTGSAWSKLADVVARPADRLESVTDRNAGDAARFYRAVTPRRP